MYINFTFTSIDALLRWYLEVVEKFLRIYEVCYVVLCCFNRCLEENEPKVYGSYTDMAHFLLDTC